jgi:hypothetical protein
MLAVRFANMVNDCMVASQGSHSQRTRGLPHQNSPSKGLKSGALDHLHFG